MTVGLLKNVQLGLGTEYYSNLRIQQMRSLKALSLEALVDGSLQPDSGKGNISSIALRTIGQLYDTHRSLSNLDSNAFSSRYASTVAKINMGNVC